MIFGNKLLSSFLMLAIYLFLKCLRATLQTDTQKQKYTLKTHSSSLARICATLF